MTDVEMNARLLESVAQTWEWMDGPAKSGFMADGKKISYFSLGPGAVGERGHPHGYYGCRDLERISAWYPDLVNQVAESGNRTAAFKRGEGESAPDDILPGTHKIVWRTKPETHFSEDDGRWRIYSRLAFVPKGSEIGEETI